MPGLGFHFTGRVWILTFGLVLAGTEARASVERTVRHLFLTPAGHAAADVNADGRASAADVLGKILGGVNPTEDGPYGTGFDRLDFVKASETNPREQRRLRTSVWYPAPPGTFPNDVNPGGQPRAPFAEGLQALPVVLFSHGSCGFERQSIFLVRRLATWGFIVAAPPHPGNTTSDFLTCSTPATLADSFVNRPEDIRFVLDRLLELNQDPTSFLYQRIDPARVSMSGHSFGGLTTLRVLARDPRFVAGLALAPVTRTIREEVQQIRRPVMIQVGVLDPLLADARSGFAWLEPPKMLVELERTTHSPFSDFCLECTPETLSPEEVHWYVLRYAVPFLLAYGAADHRFDRFLEPAATPAGANYDLVWSSPPIEARD